MTGWFWWICIITNTVSHFLNIDVWYHVFNPLIGVKLLLHSGGVKVNLQLILNRAKMVREKTIIHSRQSFLNFAYVLKKLQQLERLMRIYPSKYHWHSRCTQFTFETYWLWNFNEHGCCDRRHKLSVLVILSKFALRHYHVAKKKKFKKGRH